MRNLEKFGSYAFIIAAIIIGLYLRIVNPWNSVFVPWMKGARLSGNDPWYYFRLIDSTLHNFPNRIWFDAFTNYPYGTFVHFGPFLVYLSTFAAKIFNATTSAEIRNVIAFIPAIGGALLAIPVYIFASSIFGRKAGVISSLLVVLIPGQLMARSVLSFNDHHVWEVFWQTLTLALFAYSINKWKDQTTWKSKNIIYPILSGLALGLYLLTWAPGFVAAFFILIYVFLMYILKDYIDVNTKNLASIGVITLLTASVVYLPFSFVYPHLNTIYYSPFQLLVLLSSAAIIAFFYSIELLKAKGFFSKIGVSERIAFPLTIALVFAVVLAIISVISPDFLHYIFGIIRVIQPRGGALTVAEVQPFFTIGGGFSLVPAWQNFSMTFFFAIPAFFLIAYEFLKERKQLYLLALIWGVAMFVAMCGQNRFAYYFGAVSAIFAAVTLDYILSKLSFYEYVKASLNKEKKKFSSIKIALSIILILILFYPTFAQANTYSKYSAGGINEQWFNALTWMRNNTPNKAFYDKFYYELYKPPSKIGEPYSYPKGVYSIMSWWDYGHWITAIAHRIPVANPFQEGIGNKYNNVPGAAPFFTAFNESYADEIAKKLNVKYVISDVEMETGKFYAMAVWAEGSLEKAQQIYYKGYGVVYQDINGNIGISLTGRIPFGAKALTVVNIPSKSYYETMEAKLHLFDGNGLKHYRMVYESKSSAYTYFGFLESLYKTIYNSVYAKKKIDTRPSGYVKIFEFVKGAVVEGNATGDYVVAKVKIKTNQGRIFEYTQKVKVVNGKYKLILPYAQNTTYPTKPIGDYTIECKGVVKKLHVTDEEVENGEVIHFDLT